MGGVSKNIGLRLGCNQSRQTWCLNVHRNRILAIAIGGNHWQNAVFVIAVFIAIVVVVAAAAAATIFIIFIASIVSTCCALKRSLQLVCILFGKLGTKATLADILGGQTVGAA